MAIRERDVDVYTDNRRTITTIDSKEFGQVAYVIIGAMLVGSIVITRFSFFFFSFQIL